MTLLYLIGAFVAGLWVGGAAVLARTRGAIAAAKWQGKQAGYAQGVRQAAAARQELGGPADRWGRGRG